MNRDKVLITGAAGFIGFHLANSLLTQGYQVYGIDNLNDYYDVKLKESRLTILKRFPNFSFTKGSIANEDIVNKIFQDFSPQYVVNLAAQAGVRYSIDNPKVYMESNVMGFYNILEACRHNPVKHLLFASSSSVYGNQEKTPFSVDDNVDHPISLYAATKKSNELMAYTYSHLYNIPVTGLRFFTVYGPYGRPDMAYFKFTNMIYKGEAIKIFNNGDMYRDFTYVDDIVTGIKELIPMVPQKSADKAAYQIFNIGNNKPEKLMYFIECLENTIGKKAEKEYLPMQPGDVYQTYADVSALEEKIHFKPKTTIEEGLKYFIDWYKEYYNV